jgi:hypothetical protein
MPFPRRLVIGALWIASLLIVAGLARAQSHQFERIPKTFVLSGGDIGFRVEGWMAGNPAGTLVIKIDGRWVEPRLAPKNRLVPTE